MGYTIVNILGALLIVTSTIVLLARTTRKAVVSYAVQSCVLVALLFTLGVITGARELLLWAVTALITKVILVPWVIWRSYVKMGSPDETNLVPRVKPAWSMVLVALEVVLCFVAVGGIQLPTAAAVRPALAIALAHFFVGLTCIISSRNIMKQVFGYCLMENGSHVTLALLAPQAPEIVEIGITTDAIFAVIVMAFLVMRIWRGTQSLDVRELTNLKG